MSWLVLLLESFAIGVVNSFRHSRLNFVLPQNAVYFVVYSSYTALLFLEQIELPMMSNKNARSHAL